MRPHLPTLPQLLVAALVLALCAACPQRRGGGGPAAPPGLGCPPASGVYMASFLTPEEGNADGHTGWVLPLYDKVVDSIEGLPGYQTIDAAAAGAAGVPAPPQVAWLLAPGGPCKATIGGYYAAAIEGPPGNVAYGVELSGCAAPPAEATDASAIVLTYDGGSPEAAPTDCKAIPPRSVAARLGELDAQGTWSRPTKETPIPPAFAKIVPERPCARPDCEQLWSIAQVDVGGRTVAWAGAVNWLAIPSGDGADRPCEWKADTFSGFFVAGPDGAPVKVTEAQDHPLVLTAVLADSGGAKVLVATAPGEYSTYDLTGGAARVGRHLVWLIPHPEAFAAIDQLGPECGP